MIATGWPQMCAKPQTSVELVKFGAVDDAGDHLVHIVGRADVLGDDRVELLGVEARRADLLQLHQRAIHSAEVADDVAQNGKRVFVVLGEVVYHTGLLCVEVAAAEIFGADLLAGRGLH